MSIAWQKEMLLLVCSLDHYADKTLETFFYTLYFLQQPQTHIRRDLIITRPTRVQFAAEGTNQFTKPTFVCRVNVFIILLYLELLGRKEWRSE